MATLGSTLASSALRVPHDNALCVGDERTDYQMLDAQVNRLARAMRVHGFGHGDRCAVLGVNSSAFVLALYATAKLGGIFVPVNPRSAPAEIVHILGDSDASLLLVDPSVSAAAMQAQKLHTSSGAFSMLSLGPDPVMDDILEQSRDQSDAEIGEDVEERDDAIILYTSGTTGSAKGVLMDHHRLLWTAWSVPIGTIGMTQGASLLHVAPLYHAGQITMMLIPGVMLGAKHVIQDHFDAEAVLDAMERERVTTFFGVPTMYQLMEPIQAAKPRDLSAWTTGLYGAAPMPPEAASRLRRTFAQVKLFSCYGQTESGPSGFFANPAEALARPDVTGYRAYPTMAVRIVKHDGGDVAPGEVGEVLLRGETMMKGYWRNPAATSQAIRDGWLHSGDLARLDPDGGMTIVDRLKDMIISGGRNIYSVEVEHAIASHPAVADCAVLGKPHEIFGESVVAVVVLAADATLTLDEVRAHCRVRLSDYKLPRELIFADVPRNPSGKILKRELRKTVFAAV